MARAVDFQLQGKRALVSGSTAGIGFAIARALAAEGASVIVNGRSEQRTAAAVSAIRDSGLPDADVRGIAADLGGAEGCAKLGHVVRAPLE
jgi:NAD(P)-dependent dehydrogenase (short-subunit alcohol dehydrogenase family)